MSLLTLTFCTFCCGYLVGNVYGEYCTIDESYYSTTTSYCDYGCCGTYTYRDRECCEDSHVSVGVYVGGGVRGFVSFLFVVCCIYYCCCRVDNVVHLSMFAHIFSQKRKKI